MLITAGAAGAWPADRQSSLSSLVVGGEHYRHQQHRHQHYAASAAASSASALAAAFSAAEAGSSPADAAVLGADNIAQAAIILILDVVIICSNILIIATLATGSGGEVMNYYLISLAAADLLAGLLVVPLSIYPALTDAWGLGDVMCSVVGYVEATLWAVSVYSFMWISVDRYLAIRKPLRYETVQTPSRCQCWVIFTWLTSMLACCPPLLQGSTGYAKPYFDSEAFVCHLDWTGMAAYSVTLVVLVLCPTLATVAYTYFYIFNSMRKMRSSLLAQDKEYATALSENLSNPTHLMSFILVMTFWLSWLPFICLTLYEHVTQQRVESIPFLHFTVFWLGISNSFFKLFIYVAMSPFFRHKLRLVCATYLCCGLGTASSAEPGAKRHQVRVGGTGIGSSASGSTTSGAHGRHAGTTLAPPTTVAVNHAGPAAAAAGGAHNVRRPGNATAHPAPQHHQPSGHHGGRNHHQHHQHHHHQAAHHTVHHSAHASGHGHHGHHNEITYRR